MLDPQKQGWSHLAWLFLYVQSGVNPSCWPSWVCFAGSCRQDFRLDFWKRLICCPESREAKNPPCFTRDYFKQIPFFLRFQNILRLLDLLGDELPYPPIGTWQFSREGPCEPWSLSCRSLHMLGSGDWIGIILPCGHQARPWLHNPCCQSNPGRNKISFEPKANYYIARKGRILNKS